MTKITTKITALNIASWVVSINSVDQVLSLALTTLSIGYLAWRWIRDIRRERR